MKKQKTKFTYCFGTGCPDKEKCLRYKMDINKKKEDWLDGPYDHVRKICTLMILKSDNIEDGEGGTNN